MMGFCQKNATPEPEFEEYSGGFSTIFRFNEAMHSAVIVKEEPKKHSLSQRQKEIVVILQQGQELSAMQIRKLMREKVSVRTLQYELNKLKQAGVVKTTGHTHKLFWSIM